MHLCLNLYISFIRRFTLCGRFNALNFWNLLFKYLNVSHKTVRYKIFAKFVIWYALTLVLCNWQKIILNLGLKDLMCKHTIHPTFPILRKRCFSICLLFYVTKIKFYRICYLVFVELR